MRKELWKHMWTMGLIGAGFSPTICMLITAVSRYVSTGKLVVMSEDYVNRIGDPLAAFLLQTLVCMIYGAIGFGGTVIYEFEDWSIIRVTATHFSMLIVCFFITAFFLGWMSPGDVGACVVMVVMWIAAYFLVWLANYIAYKIEISKINDSLTEMKRKSAV